MYPNVDMGTKLKVKINDHNALIKCNKLQEN